MKNKHRLFFYLPLILLILLHVLFHFRFSLTWDFPHHYFSGLYRLGEVAMPLYNRYVPYGPVSEIAPILFSRIFPKTWFPSSYNLLSVALGIIGVFYFFRLLKENFGLKTGLSSSVLLLLIPRYVGHLHTNVKDIGMSAFFIMSVYYFHHFLHKFKIRDAILVIIAQILAFNTKIASLFLVPVFILWAIYYFQINNWMKNKEKIKKITVLLLYMTFTPILIWLLYSGININNIHEYINNLSESSALASSSPFYAVYQLSVTTPIPVLLFAFAGAFTIVLKLIKNKNSLYFLFIVLFIYSLIKYPILRLPLMDDIRYFIEIYYPLCFFTVIGFAYIGRKLSVFLFTGILAYLIFLNIQYYPYQITYNNIFGLNNDPDFWAASYGQTFAYLNSNLPEKSVVSAKLAHELAAGYIRSDLKYLLNTQSPENSNAVVILNRPHAFEVFMVADYFHTHIPQKIITNNAGIPLAYIYFNRNK